MLSSMTPTIVSKGGKVVLITGSPGGRTIINTVFSVVLAATEFGMNVRAAVDAPRLHHQWLPDTISIERGGASEDLLEKLRAMGHPLPAGGAHADSTSIPVDAAARPMMRASGGRSSCATDPQVIISPFPTRRRFQVGLFCCTPRIAPVRLSHGLHGLHGSQQWIFPSFQG